jgi:hypothetical protein
LNGFAVYRKDAMHRVSTGYTSGNENNADASGKTRHGFSSNHAWFLPKQARVQDRQFDEPARLMYFDLNNIPIP